MSSECGNSFELCRVCIRVCVCMRAVIGICMCVDNSFFSYMYL